MLRIVVGGAEYIAPVIVPPFLGTIIRYNFIVSRIILIRFIRNFRFSSPLSGSLSLLQAANTIPNINIITSNAIPSLFFESKIVPPPYLFVIMKR